MPYPKENSNTTAVVEYAISDNDLTHPALYRFKRNSMPFYCYCPKPCPVSTPSVRVSKSDWDLYPAVMREINNHE
ncbi:hypothetical protein BY458DRAFT_107364 [Sporodiniella umbellata]|nr:hypothetical protein BY458DRAFT_107364 [Sporodiniella umbellata]